MVSSVCQIQWVCGGCLWPWAEDSEAVLRPAHCNGLPKSIAGLRASRGSMCISHEHPSSTWHSAWTTPRCPFQTQLRSHFSGETCLARSLPRCLSRVPRACSSLTLPLTLACDQQWLYHIACEQGRCTPPPNKEWVCSVPLCLVHAHESDLNLEDESGLKTTTQLGRGPYKCSAHISKNVYALNMQRF